MTTLTRPRKRLTYAQVLEVARRLSPAEQRHLRDELEKLAGVQLVRPEESATARQQGRRMARAVRAELAKSVSGLLDEALREMRGRGPLALKSHPE